MFALHRWMVGHFDRVRRSPGDDILSALVAVHDEGAGLTDDELTSIAMLLLAAGFETTVNLLGNGTALLLRHPDQLAALRAGTASWSTATDEVLRFDPPVQRTARLAMRDTEVAGRRVPAGQLVVLVLAGANRDPAVFADPAVFDVRRSNAADHVAFAQDADVVHHRQQGCCPAGERGVRARRHRPHREAAAGARGGILSAPRRLSIGWLS